MQRILKLFFGKHLEDDKHYVNAKLLVFLACFHTAVFGILIILYTPHILTEAAYPHVQAGFVVYIPNCALDMLCDFYQVI